MSAFSFGILHCEDVIVVEDVVVEMVVELDGSSLLTSCSGLTEKSDHPLGLRLGASAQRRW